MRNNRTDSGYDSDEFLRRRSERCNKVVQTAKRWKLASSYVASVPQAMMSGYFGYPLYTYPSPTPSMRGGGGGGRRRHGMSLEHFVAGSLMGSVPFLWWSRPSWVTSTVERGLDYLKSEPVQETVSSVHRMLEHIGAPPPYPGANEIALALFVLISAAFFYYLLFGRKHRAQRLELAERLLKAKLEVEELSRQLQDAEAEEDEEDDNEGNAKAGNNKRRRRPSKPIRIFMEGAFDLMHYGHMNAFRLGHGLGTELVVGVNSDDTIAQCKGCAPCMNDEERQTAVASCRFVKEVVPNVPYVMTQEYLNMIMEKYDIDYVVHGDDPVIVNGKDVYAHVKAMGKYKSIPRTEGVSTTDIVGRMLLCTTRHHQGGGETAETDAGEDDAGGDTPKATASGGDDALNRALLQPRSSTFYTTSSLLQQFSLNARPPKPEETVVYIDGAWDMFHAGHARVLESAAKLGDYLIVGIHNDTVVNRNRGQNFPIMNLNERVLSVLGCKFVGDVLIDAPWAVNEEMIHSLGVTVVARGANCEKSGERHRVAEDLGILRTLESPLDLTVDEILRRIRNNRDRYIKKFEKKKKKEDAYYDARYGRGETTAASKKEGGM
eukprot:g3385.t1